MNTSPDTIKRLEKKRGEELLDNSHGGDFLALTPKAQSIKANMNPSNEQAKEFRQRKAVTVWHHACEDRAEPGGCLGLGVQGWGDVA